MAQITVGNFERIEVVENRLSMGKDASLHSLVATGCIFIWQNMLPEITFQRWSNLDSKEYSGKGLLFGDGVILIRKNARTGIILW